MSHTIIGNAITIANRCRTSATSSSRSWPSQMRPGNNRGTTWEFDLRHWNGGIRYPSELHGGSTSHSSHTETTNPQYCWILLHLRISSSLSHSPDQQDPSSHYKCKAEFASYCFCHTAAIAKSLHQAGDRAKYVCVLTSDGLSIEDSRVKFHLWKIALSVR